VFLSILDKETLLAHKQTREVKPAEGFCKAAGIFSKYSSFNVNRYKYINKISCNVLILECDNI